MKTVILAGGMGTRLAEETDNRPKSMIDRRQTDPEAYHESILESYI